MQKKWQWKAKAVDLTL